MIVEVLAGAVTRADFVVHQSFSVAGNVQCSTGAALEAAALELEGPEGTVIGSAKSDSFGFYRIDGVRPGTYLLRAWGPGQKGPPVTRRVDVTDDFLFGADVAIPCTRVPSDPVLPPS